MTFNEMLIKMYGMAVWDAQGRQYLPVWDYDWKNISHYARGEEAIETNITNWKAENEIHI